MAKTRTERTVKKKSRTHLKMAKAKKRMISSKNRTRTRKARVSQRMVNHNPARLRLPDNE